MEILFTFYDEKGERERGGEEKYSAVSHTCALWTFF